MLYVLTRGSCDKPSSWDTNPHRSLKNSNITKLWTPTDPWIGEILLNNEYRTCTDLRTRIILLSYKHPLFPELEKYYWIKNLHWSPNKRNIRYQTLADSWTREIFLTKEPEPHSSLTIRNILTFEPTLFCEQEKYFLTINPHSSLIKKNNLIYENSTHAVPWIYWIKTFPPLSSWVDLEQQNRQKFLPDWLTTGIKVGLIGGNSSFPRTSQQPANQQLRIFTI